MLTLHLPLKKDTEVLKKLPTGECSACHLQNFRKVICNQIASFIDRFLSKYECSFRKGFNAQQCLLTMLEKWKRAVNTNNVFGALLTDLSKALFVT